MDIESILDGVYYDIGAESFVSFERDGDEIVAVDQFSGAIAYEYLESEFDHHVDRGDLIHVSDEATENPDRVLAEFVKEQITETTTDAWADLEFAFRKSNLSDHHPEYM